jgi:sulfite exporter TauE/SafE
LTEALFSGALVTGLLGSGHCIGMCGGLVAALSLSSGRRAGVAFHVLYHAGRVSTYTLIGALAGWLGMAAARSGGILGFGRGLLIGVDIFVILVGLGTAGAVGRLNLTNLAFARPLQSLTASVRRLRRLPPTLGALPLGMVLGFLPYGFLYAVALAAASTASPATGAQVMVGFGIGTVPALLAFGGAALWLRERSRGWMPRAAGLSVALVVSYNLWQHFCGFGFCL